MTPPALTPPALTPPTITPATTPPPLYAREGYSVAPLFAPALIEAAQQDLTDHMNRIAQALYLPFETSCPDEPLATRIDRIYRTNRSLANLLCTALTTDAHSGPRLQALAHSPDLLAHAQDLAGRKLDGAVVMRVRAGIAALPDHLYPWRSDVAFDDGSECARFCVTAWIPLTDAGAETAGLELAPCRLSAPKPAIKDRMLQIPEAELHDLPRARPDCPVGSVLFFDRFVPHRSLPVSGNARFALSVWIKAAREGA